MEEEEEPKEGEEPNAEVTGVVFLNVGFVLALSKSLLIPSESFVIRVRKRR